MPLISCNHKERETPRKDESQKDSKATEPGEPCPQPTSPVKHKPQIDHSPAHPEETPQEVEPEAR